MSKFSLKSLIDNETFQSVLTETEKMAISTALDFLEAAVKRTKTEADDKLFSTLLRECADRIEALASEDAAGVDTGSETA